MSNNKKNKILSLLLALVLLLLTLPDGVHISRSEPFSLNPDVTAFPADDFDVTYDMVNGDETGDEIGVESIDEETDGEELTDEELGDDFALVDENPLEPFSTIEVTERFVQGYVRVRVDELLYADVDLLEPVGAFGDIGYAWATVEQRGNYPEEDVLNLIFDTPEARAASEGPVTGFIRFDAVDQLTELEQEEVDAEIEASMTDGHLRVNDMVPLFEISYYQVSLVEEEPTAEPTEEPSEEPTEEPTAEPTEEPAAEPTEAPIPELTEEPTAEPFEEPAAELTEEPFEEPAAEPTEEPAEEPAAEPTEEPAEEPAAEATEEPFEEPAAEPTEEPTPEPTVEPTVEPETSSLPRLVLRGMTLADAVNMRAEPTTDSERVAQVKPAGTEVEVLDSVDVDGAVWYLVRWNGVEGYIRGDLLKIWEEPEEDDTDDGLPAPEEVTEDSETAETEETADVSLYARPDVDAEVVASIPAGETLTLLEILEIDGVVWYRVVWQEIEGYAPVDTLGEMTLVEDEQGSFVQPYPCSVSEEKLNEMDFSSRRLLVSLWSDELLTKDTYVLGQMDDLYLLLFATVEETRNAYTYYVDQALFAVPDTTLTAAEGTEGLDVLIEDGEDLTPQDNPLTRLSALLQGGSATTQIQSAGRKKQQAARAAVTAPLIALIDTGVSDGGIDRYSVISDGVSDDHGHGDNMLAYIREENPDARVVSIKALDAYGRGSVTAVYAAVELAIAKGASIINLSVSAHSSDGNAALASIIREAVEQGIAVVAAAGNNGADASLYTPGNISGVTTIGAVDDMGYLHGNSNGGDVVDYYVEAESTSEAAARFSGVISLSESLPDFMDVVQPYLDALWKIYKTAEGEGALREDEDDTNDDTFFTASPNIDVTVKKEWAKSIPENMRPDEVTVHLLANGKDTGKTATLRASEGWTAEFNGVSHFESKYDEKEGKNVSTVINYTVSEDIPDELLAAWDKTIRELTRASVIVENAIDLASERDVPDVLCSALVQDCIGRGKTIKEGGAIYDFISGLQVGVANMADSLAAIKKLVYEEKQLTAEQLWSAILDDFTSPESQRVQKLLIEGAPKYGNDSDYVDQLVVMAYDSYLDEMKKYPNTRYGRGPIGGIRYGGTSSISANVGQGYGTMATPDGRKAHQPLAEGCSPAHSMDKNGPTAVFKSVSKLRIDQITGGVLLNQKVTPTLLAKEENKQKLTMLIRTFFDRLHGYHVQYNVVDRATLLDAQAHPEKHRDLIVRVAGYSAFFNVLSKATQDDIIARTEQTL